MLSDGEREGKGGGWGRVPGLARYTRRPSTFQNGSQGDFPTGARAEPLKRNRIRLQPQLGPLEGETRVNNRRVRSRRTPRWQRGLCNPGLAPVPGHLAPSARALLLAGPGSVPRDLAGDRAKWECPAGKSFCSTTRPRYARGHKCGPLCPPSAAKWNPHPVARCTLLGARSSLPAALTLAAAMLWPWCRQLWDPLSGWLALGTPATHFPSRLRWGRRFGPEA